MKVLETKPQVKNMVIKFYDLFLFVIKHRDEKEIEDNRNENDYISFNDIVSNQYVGRKIIMKY